MRVPCVVAVFGAFALFSQVARADSVSYRLPPKAIEAVLRAPAIPVVLISPKRDVFLIAAPLRYPPVADLARPMLRLAGLRIDPRTNGIHHRFAYTSLRLQRVYGGAAQAIALPESARIVDLRYSPDGAHFAFGNATAHGTDLYVGSTHAATVTRVPGVRLNSLFGTPIAWLPDGAHLVVREIDRRGSAPAEPENPSGPIVQEALGKSGQIVTYEDLLTDPHDEDLFDYYATSRLAVVDVRTDVATAFGPRGIYTSVLPSPDGKMLLTEHLHKPYSYLFPYDRFPAETEVVDLHGNRVLSVVSRGLQDRLPVEGVPIGPRDITWEEGAPESLAWVEALDGGDPRAPATLRDRLVTRAVGGGAVAVEEMRTAHRIDHVAWLANDARAFVREYDTATRLTQVWLLDARPSGRALTALGAPLRDGDRYDDPGLPLLTQSANDDDVILHSGDNVYLSGAGWGPDGRRPFLDRFNLADLTKQRVFRSALTPLDVVLGIADNDARSILIARQSPVLPPNLFLHSTSGDRALTAFTDPSPELRQIERRVVTYKRPDGVALSFTLYLPPGYRPGTRLPTFLWAYPLEFNDASVASQNPNSVQTFTSIAGPSELFMALAGYAVLENATIPIVGDPQTVNDTYVTQLVAAAKAAIDKAVEIGVTDPDRVAVGGHSYGAFMTANLLAHSQLFRAGIARSGAYNRTLTPFGFQNERRTYWEATDLYTKMSPFTYANAIKDPLLLIHGMIDDNTGTFPIQSERMFAAIEGNGGTARLVMLPAEAHGYLGRESIETVLAEMVDWLDRFVKNAGPRTATASSK